MYIYHTCKNVNLFAIYCRKIERFFFITVNKNAFKFLWIYQTQKLKKNKQHYKTHVVGWAMGVGCTSLH